MGDAKKNEAISQIFLFTTSLENNTWRKEVRVK